MAVRKVSSCRDSIQRYPGRNRKELLGLRACGKEKRERVGARREIRGRAKRKRLRFRPGCGVWDP